LEQKKNVWKATAVLGAVLFNELCAERNGAMPLDRTTFVEALWHSNLQPGPSQTVPKQSETILVEFPVEKVLNSLVPASQEKNRKDMKSNYTKNVM